MNYIDLPDAIVMKISNFQVSQEKHDQEYHKDIYHMDVSRRMNHITLHLVKYLLDTQETHYAKIFIMTCSAANLLNIDMVSCGVYREPVVVGLFGQSEDVTLRVLIDAVRQLVKACEANDHVEDYPVRNNWNDSIKKICNLFMNLPLEDQKNLVQEALTQRYIIENG